MDIVDLAVTRCPWTAPTPVTAWFLIS